MGCTHEPHPPSPIRTTCTQDAEERGQKGAGATVFHLLVPVLLVLVTLFILDFARVLVSLVFVFFSTVVRLTVLTSSIHLLAIEKARKRTIWPHTDTGDPWCLGVIDIEPYITRLP